VPGLARLLLALVALATPTSSLHGAWRPRAATASRPTRRLANIKSQLIIARLEGARDSSEGGTPGWSGLRGDPGLIDITVVPDGFRTGFVSIVGSPNVGKSTLMNALVDDDLSIATNKAQTTRQRITGVVTGQDFQIVYCDTPGILEPNYRLQEGMMQHVSAAVTDADVLLVVTDIFQEQLLESAADHEGFLRKLVETECPIIVAVNKIDLIDDASTTIEEVTQRWTTMLPGAEVVLISALERLHVGSVLEKLTARLPESPPLYPADYLTDKPERFFAAEIIREQIFKAYAAEIPYSCEVVVTTFKDAKKILNIEAEILVLRDSQKGVVIGKQGAKIKQVGIESRLNLEKFFCKKVFVSLRVKVDAKWRSSDTSLRGFGYLT